MKSALLLVLALLASFCAAACAPEEMYGGARPRRLLRGADDVAQEEDPLTPDTDENERNVGGATAALVDAAPPMTAFTNTAPYQILTPTAQSSEHHGGVSNAGKECLLCHTGAGAPKFALGGTVYTTKGGGAGASGVQVRVVDPNGDEIALVGTDADGNFWLDSDITIPAGSRVGVRDGTRTKLMGAPIGTGSCAQTGCHVSTRPIFIGD